MPSKYCSAICGTHSFSSIFKTDLLPCKSRKPKIYTQEVGNYWVQKFIGCRSRKKFLKWKDFYWKERETYQLLVEERSNDCFEYAIRVNDYILQFHAECPAIDCRVGPTKR